MDVSPKTYTAANSLVVDAYILGFKNFQIWQKVKIIDIQQFIMCQIRDIPTYICSNSVKYNSLIEDSHIASHYRLSFPIKFSAFVKKTNIWQLKKNTFRKTI